MFEEFLKSEFSDENVQFWKACERFKTLPVDTLKKESEAIFEEYIAPHAPKMVNYSRLAEGVRERGERERERRGEREERRGEERERE